MNDVGVSLDRARDKVAQMQARAAATDDLLNSGALRDLTAAPDADIERQLAALGAQAEVDRQLKEMKDAARMPRRPKCRQRSRRVAEHRAGADRALSGPAAPGAGSRRRPPHDAGSTTAGTGSAGARRGLNTHER